VSDWAPGPRARGALLGQPESFYLQRIAKWPYLRLSFTRTDLTVRPPELKRPLRGPYELPGSMRGVQAPDGGNPLLGVTPLPKTRSPRPGPGVALY